MGSADPCANTSLQELLLVVDPVGPHAPPRLGSLSSLDSLCLPSLRQGLSDLLLWALQLPCPLPDSPKQTGSPGCPPGSQHLISLFVSSIKRLCQAPPVLCVKDVNPNRTQMVSCALAHHDLKGFAAEGFSGDLCGSCCYCVVLWGAGQSRGRALTSLPATARGWDLAPLPSRPPLHPRVSLPRPCRVDAEGGGAAMGAGQCHGKDALPHTGHPGAEQRGDFPSMPGAALAHVGVQPIGLTPTCPPAICTPCVPCPAP